MDIVDIDIIPKIDGEQTAIGSDDKLIMAIKYSGTNNVREYDITNLKFQLTSEESEHWAAGNYSYEIRIEYADGNRYLVCKSGGITVEEVMA